MSLLLGGMVEGARLCWDGKELDLGFVEEPIN